ncbi:GUN4 domain-containing protein [Prochlorococcus sp. MIT 1223]|uniref:GUN4 domain-containing protein n=1 Tax=Prochlorococcus sp. MIT 1223 TaxID=3096217 RepID=UPI002A749776|nr:GUN4 domain-containing protein [Prochlorococcus sp. MIT 1223]
MASEKSHSNNLSIKELLDQISSSTTRKRKTLLSSLEKRVDELIDLDSAGLNNFDPEGDDYSAGFILQLLNRNNPDILAKVLTNKPDGWFKLKSSVAINYGPLQECLLKENFEEADRITSSSLRELAGEAAVKRGYVYFSEVSNIPSDDLITIDRLWVAYSQAKFGFSVQASLLDSLGGRYEMLWPKIGWKKNGVWTRYPGSFDWSLAAPDGHMPLVNQLRGVRLIDSLLSHQGIKSRV